ncbi:MAG: hypothetical protein NZ529_08820 [Cytophagaceae bacterium]|nr:hypothetical protein [Cytophagaceae bacterium]MDW8456885.1 hypothetical protein [Cytophagaceae bacterium]
MEKTVLLNWHIQCNHSPETIDRILMPIRKRGLCVNSFTYKKTNDQSATCSLEFEAEEADVDRIYKNMIRIQDVVSISKS